MRRHAQPNTCSYGLTFLSFLALGRGTGVDDLFSIRVGLPTNKMAIGENPTLALCPEALPSLHVQEDNVMIKSLGRPTFLKTVISGAHGWQEGVSFSYN